MDLRKLLSSIQGTLFHPQWLVFKNEKHNLKLLCETLHGRVLDIGCAYQKPKKFLSKDTEYIGLDYYVTATQWYSAQPQVFGDAQTLPIADTAYSSPLESAALLTNIALSKTTLNWLKRKNPLGIFLLFTLPVLIPGLNLIAWMMSKISPSDPMMASGYQMYWKKQ